MNENYNLKKYGADKIAFLGLFIIAVLIAQLMVSINSKLDFSEPIELEHTGLSISIPTGKGWQNAKQWKYLDEDDEFTLSSNFITARGLPDIAVNCRYFLNTQNVTPINLLDQQNDDSNNIDTKIKLIQKGDLKIQWVNIQTSFNIFLGIAELPNNRTVTIEVIETAFDIYIAEMIFKQIIESLSFNEDNPIKTGAEFITEIKNKGIETLLNNSGQQSCFFIQDSGNNNVGFTIDVLGKINSDEENFIRGASHLFMLGSYQQEQRANFQCDNNLNKYLWQSLTNIRNIQAGMTITFDESGTINITNQVNNQSVQYSNCSNVVPDILLESFINPIIENNINKVVMDVIDSDGIISPTLFSFKPVEEKTEGYSNAVTLEALDGSFSETFYLNDKNQVVKAAGNYFLARTDIETIEEEFPDMTAFISNQMQQFNESSL